MRKGPEKSPLHSKMAYGISKKTGGLSHETSSQGSGSSNHSPGATPPRLPFQKQVRNIRQSPQHPIIVAPQRAPQNDPPAEIKRGVSPSRNKQLQRSSTEEGNASLGIWPRRTQSMERSTVESTMKPVLISSRGTSPARPSRDPVKAPESTSLNNTLRTRAPSPGPSRKFQESPQSGGDGGKSAYLVKQSVSPNLTGLIPQDYSPAGSASSSHPAGGFLVKSPPSSGGAVGSGYKDLKADLEAAEQAIEELQQEKVDLQRGSRVMAREVENLRQQLAEAMRLDKGTEIELRTVTLERDRLAEEVERLREVKERTESQEDGAETIKWEALEAKRNLREAEEELGFQREEVDNLRGQVKKLQVKRGRKKIRGNGLSYKPSLPHSTPPPLRVSLFPSFGPKSLFGPFHFPISFLFFFRIVFFSHSLLLTYLEFFIHDSRKQIGSSSWQFKNLRNQSNVTRKIWRNFSR